MAEFVEYKSHGIWEYFWSEKGGHSAKCKICNSTLKATGGSTKGLHEHLKWLHSCNVQKRKPTTNHSRQHRNHQLDRGPWRSTWWTRVKIRCRLCWVGSLHVTVYRSESSGRRRTSVEAWWQWVIHMYPPHSSPFASRCWDMDKWSAQ